MTPGTVRYLAAFAGSFLLFAACCVAYWRLRAASARSLAAQRVIASRAHLDTYRPHYDDRLWDDWAKHHGGM